MEYFSELETVILCTGKHAQVIQGHIDNLMRDEETYVLLGSASAGKHSQVEQPPAWKANLKPPDKLRMARIGRLSD